MSNWQDEPPLPEGVTRFPRDNKRRNINQTVTPYVQFDSDPDRVEILLTRLRASHGQIVDQYKRFFARSKEISGVASVAAMQHRDGSIVGFELRMSYRDKSKRYATIFRASISNSDNPKDDGPDLLCDKWAALRDNGLYLPTNGQALFAALDRYKAGSSLKPVFLWCEGEKTRAAVERRVTSEAALREFAKQGLVPVTSATLGGKAGVDATNYAFVLPTKCSPNFLKPGVNDKALDLATPVHFLIRDADDEGYSESYRLGERLINEFQVDEKQLRWVEPPAGAGEGWDDADPLPIGITEEDRLLQIVNAVPFVKQQWKKKKKTINASDLDNCLKALKQVGIEACYDTAIGGVVSKAPEMYSWHGGDPTDVELLHVAYDAVTKIMMLDADAKHVRVPVWRQAFDLLVAQTPQIDSIEAETHAAIERGREFMTDDNKPERLFVRTFGLPDTQYYRACGTHLIRDMLAFRLRPAFDGPALLPQITYLLVGPENFGKSTFPRVLSGAHPTQGDAPRYTDNVVLADLSPANNGQIQLRNKVRGKTAIELADRTLGETVTRSQADALKAFVNMGQVFYRPMSANNEEHLNIRSPSIFTTNNTAPISVDMGVRRWIIIDLTNSLPLELRVRPDTDQERRLYIASIRDNGMTWLYRNLDAMLAHMYESDLWKGSLQAGPEFASLIVEHQTGHRAETTAEVALRDDIMHWTEIALHESICVVTQDIQACLTDRLRRPPHSHEYTRLLKQEGWLSVCAKIDGVNLRCWASQKTASPSKVVRWVNATWVIRERREASPEAIKQMDLPHDTPF